MSRNERYGWSRSTTEEPVEAKPAATVVALKVIDDALHVLMLKRNPALPAYGGAWVFPGGRVDAEDFSRGSDEYLAARVAAAREAKEEAGIDIHDEELVPFAHWTTPVIRPKRFSTWFFAVDISHNNQSLQVDGQEIVEAKWFQPETILRLHQEGEMELVPPTYITLLECRRHSRPETLLQHFSAKDVEHFLPKAINTESLMCYLYPGDSGYDSGDPALDSVQHRLLIRDNEWSYRKPD